MILLLVSLTCDRFAMRRHGTVLHVGAGEDPGEVWEDIRLVSQGPDDGEEGH